MNIFRKAYCRIYQTAFRLALPVLPYREPKILHDIRDVSKELKALNIHRVLLITDKPLYSLGITKGLEESLRRNYIEVSIFSETRPNPTVSNVENAKQLYIDKKCEAIIGFGGGSSIDCAKAVGAMIAYPKKSLNQMKGLLKVLRRIPTLIAIPTTAGTGSEVTVTAVIADPDTKHKYTMNNFTFIPKIAVLDEKVTFSLPKSLTATTGMDALTHATEAYIGNSTTKQTRALSKKAVRMIFENIETAYNEPQNKSARKNMLDASYIAGIAFSKSYVGYIHAIAHSLGGEYNIPHGLANAVIMPYVLEVYGNKAHKKLYELALCAGVADKHDSIETGAKKYIEAVKSLNKKLSIPNGFSQIKLTDIDKMASHANKEANPLYPVPKLMDKKELKSIYRSIYKGAQDEY